MANPHFRVVNGQTVYAADEGQGRPAELHERTAIGKHRSGDYYLRATDAEDGRQIMKAAQEQGIEVVKTRTGASHFGRIGAYDHFRVQGFQAATAILGGLGRAIEKAHGYTKTVNGKLVSVKGYERKGALSKKAAELHSRAYDASETDPGKDKAAIGAGIHSAGAQWASGHAEERGGYGNHMDAAERHREAADSHHELARDYHKTGDHKQGVLHGDLGNDHHRMADRHMGEAAKFAKPPKEHEEAPGEPQDELQGQKPIDRAKNEQDTHDLDAADLAAKEDAHTNGVTKRMPWNMSGGGKHPVAIAHKATHDAIAGSGSHEDAAKAHQDAHEWAKKMADHPDTKQHPHEGKMAKEMEDHHAEMAALHAKEHAKKSEGREIHKAMVERDAKRLDYQMTQVGGDPIALEALAMRKRALLGENEQK